MTREVVPIGVILGADRLLSDVCAVHRAVYPHRYQIVMTSQKGVQAHQSAARIGTQSKEILWRTHPCQMRLVLRLEKRVDCAGVSQPTVVIDRLVHYLGSIKHDALPTCQSHFYSQVYSWLIWSPSPPSFMSLPQILPTHASEVSLSSCVLSRHLSKLLWVGLTMIPQFGMFSLLIREKVNTYHTFGTPAIAHPSPAVHRRSHLGIPLRDHHWYAIKRGDCAIAHVVWSFTRPLRGAHILTP